MKLRMVLLFTLTGASSAAAAGAPGITSSIERLGMRLYKDRNLSFNGTQACQGCHNPLSGFADRSNAMHPHTHVVSIGADGVSRGARNAPTAAYAGFSPPLTLVDGEWIGGLFWDGRATGHELGDPLAEQAKGPLLNPVEMAMPDAATISNVVRQSSYLNLWINVFGAASLDNVPQAYDLLARAVAAYERSPEVTRFGSRFDLAPESLSEQELRGLELVNTYCSGCHVTTETARAPRPLFTNYSYANIGLPSNPLVPLESPDLGLGPVVHEPAQDGKFKVPTLRNVSKTAPYGHNGGIARLRDMVAFINDSGGAMPEVPRNLSPEVGAFGLTEAEVDSIVAFLSTLEDGT